MMAVSAAIREKESWEKKYKNPVTRERWKEDTKANLKDPRQFEYVINELAYYESLKDGPLQVLIKSLHSITPTFVLLFFDRYQV